MGDNLNRRDFFGRASCLSLGAAAVGGSAFAQAPIKRAGGARLKVSLNAYSFNKVLTDHLKGAGQGMSLFELALTCTLPGTTTFGRAWQPAQRRGDSQRGSRTPLSALPR